MAWIVTFLWNLIQEQRGDIKPDRPSWLFWPPVVSGTAIATTRWRSEDEMWSQVVAQMRALPFVALSEGKFRIADEPEALLSVSWIAARGWVGPLTKGGGFLVAGFSWNTCLCQAVKLLLLVILHPYVMQGSTQSTVHGLYGRGIWLVSPEIRSRLDACLGTLGCLSLFSTDTAGSPRSPGKVPICKHCQGPNFSGKHSQMVQEKHSDGVWQCLTSHSACMLTALKKLHTRYPHEEGGVWPGGTLLQLSSNKPRECTC